MNKKRYKRILSIFMTFALVLSTLISSRFVRADAAGMTTVKIHYLRSDGNYQYNGKDWNLWVWDKANNGGGFVSKFIGQDEDGKYTAVVMPKTSAVGLIVRTDEWVKDTGDVIIDTSTGDVDVYITASDTLGNANVTQKPLVYNYDTVNLKVHYFRFDGNYTPWDLWLWPNTKNGSAYEFTGVDDYGKVSAASFTDMNGIDSIGVIVRTPDWSQKDISSDRYISLAYADKHGNINAYLLQDEPTIYYAADQVDKSKKITMAKMDTFHDVNFQVNIPVAYASTVKLLNGTTELVSVVTLSPDGRSGNIHTSDALDMNEKYTVSIEGYSGGNVVFGDIYSSEDFKNAYDYSGDLGALYAKDKTTFKVWSPAADNVSLNLYTAGSGDNKIKTVPMVKGDKGVWSLDQAGDLNGTYYTYSITINGTTNETEDLYSKAVGVNGDRSMVMDLSTTNPAGWDKDKGPKVKNQTDAIIYEVQLRDISMDPDSGIKLKGKYLGLTEKGTISSEGEATGIDHLKELGINEVHILPSFDFATIDETKLNLNQYNWGYDPKNYQAPEGSFATDPSLGNVRITEMKQMIEALHKAGIGVIMDSVFNHTYDWAQSPFSKTVPDYFYRHNADGSMTNGSGCGNDTASERSMFRKYMIDTVTYWAKEYHIDGFRFDLMGLHDIDTMNDMRAALDQINPHILMYGEGWDMGTLPADQRATKVNESKLSDRIASFSDDIRDGVKGHVFTPTSGGFVNYNGLWKKGDGTPYSMRELKEQVKFGIVASTQHDGIDYSKTPYGSKPWAKEPTQTVNYVSCHDNNTLWDRIQLSEPNTSEADKIKMDEMSAFIVLTSQGIPFIQAGQEMLGTKVNPNYDPNDPNSSKFVENSYNSPDSVNEIDWSRKSTYNSVVKYYEGLIKLRKEHPAFRMPTTAEIQKNLTFLNTDDNTIAYTISGNANDDKWNKIAVIINAGNNDEQIALPQSGWTVVVSGGKAGTDALARVKGNIVTVTARTSIVLADTLSFNRQNYYNSNNN